ncbi:MAG: STAS/SEC14 domain-containing protein [Novosphingobium sp.]
MIEVDFCGDNIVMLTPKGNLTAEDFSELSVAIDGYINGTDKIPNLVIHAGQLPNWDDFRAIKEHMRFVRNHHRLVKKVAIIGDTLALKALPLLMDHFVAAKIRRFSEAKIAEALIWAKSSEDHPGNFELLDGFPADVVAVKARGIITSQDYREVLLPFVEKKLKGHARLKLLFVLDEDFDSYSEAAAWDDLRFGFSHIGDFSKIALVTDIGWIRHGAKLFSPLVKADIHIFDVAELDDARSWIKG